MKYKLMISDYDGTLGGAPLNTIDIETLNAIREFQNKGGKFVICTGRMFTSIQRICKSVGLKGVVVAFQGASIRDIESGEFLVNGGVEPQMIAEAIDDFINDDLMPLAYIGETMYYQDNVKYHEHIEVYKKALKSEAIAVSDLKAEILKQNKKISKACALCDLEKIKVGVKKYSEKYKNTNLLFNSGANYLLECINKEYTKGRAVKFLSEYFNVPLSEVITVGDSTNDIPLLDGEWHGVAVGDAKEELKKVAKEITVDFKDKPILHLLKKYCL